MCCLSFLFLFQLIMSGEVEASLEALSCINDTDTVLRFCLSRGV